MTFREIIEYEGVHPGSYFKRNDYPAQWLIWFDPDNAGKMVQCHMDKKPTPDTELYHHDFMDGVWEVVA